MKILLIDDVRQPYWIRNPDCPDSTAYRVEDVTIRRDGESGLEALVHEGPWDVLLLDHDLGYGKSGSDIIKFLNEYTHLIPAKVYLVTANPVAGHEMWLTIEKWRKAGIVKATDWIRT